ncbi:MAG: peptidylprolyl isomerase [Gemmatimonadetes bacterium]|nr:peptidylprolyl isomerase [Gemmatimonadota bacterium]
MLDSRIIRAGRAGSTALALLVLGLEASAQPSGARQGRGGQAQQPGPAATAQGPGAAATVPSLRRPTGAQLAQRGPDSADVVFYTTRGAITVRTRRSWAPLGSARLFHAVQARYYDRTYFYRVLGAYIAQWGFHGEPAVSEAWDEVRLRDDPRGQSNKRGTITFATAGPHTRTTQIFINLSDNTNLDPIGFVPVAEITDGMAAADSLYAGYGEVYPRGNGPFQAKIATQGNAYLKKEFPKLDSIDSARLVRRWP